MGVVPTPILLRPVRSLARVATLRGLIIAGAITVLTAVAQPTPSAPNLVAEGGNSRDYDMAPETNLAVVEAAVAQIATPIPPGPFQPTWESLRENYRVPAWFNEAKFGLFLHWGPYAVPAHHNEWYEKHMYAGFRSWHAEHFGPHDKFGYKDFLPLFTAEKFEPDAWAALFQKAGARFVIPTAQHHDNFALWDSAVTPFNAARIGARRDLIGDLAKAVRARGLKFGVSNHGIENFQFINPAPELLAELKAKRADLFDPAWADFYNVADRSEAALRKFLVNWFERNVELIDKYQPDMLWFDNGVDIRYLDPLKLRIAAYYYNRAASWGKAVSLSTKKAAFAPSDKNTETIGSIIDFEKIGARSPAGIRTGAWQVDEPIGSTWGYTRDMKVNSAASIIAKLADTVSKNGTLLLNLSPRADGVIPQAQQDTLLAIGQWLAINGEAIYGTHNWTTFGSGGARGEPGPHVRYTVKGDALYAILIGPWAARAPVTLSALKLSAGHGEITRVTLLGSAAPVTFTQDSDGLSLRFPADSPSPHAAVLKIEGLRLNPSTATPDGNPR